MDRYGKRLGEVLAAVLLLHAAAGCTVDTSPAREDPPNQQAREETEPPESEDSLSAQWNTDPALSCEDIRPATLGPGRTLIYRSRGRPGEADCGPGTSDGRGSLALMNSGPFGSTAWDVVSRDGVPTGGVIAGGDVGNLLIPLPRGFQNFRFPPGGVLLNAYTTEGRALRSVRLNEDYRLPIDIVSDLRGGTVVAQWTPRTDGTQVLTFQFFDATGLPRAEPVEVASAPLSEGRGVFVGVDTKGRLLLLWSESSPDTWVGQWLKRNGRAITERFSFPRPTPAFFRGLRPLAGGGLALQSTDAWALLFPSGEPVVQPPPDWLASHPNADLFLIHGQRANVLVPPPTQVDGAGCRETLLLFASDGTACGEIALPFGRAFCGERPGVGVDGTIVQQIGLNIPANDQCAWRWWPALLK